MPGRLLRGPSIALIVLAVALPVTARGIDVTGRWRLDVEDGVRIEVADFVQAGSAVTVVVAGKPSPTFTGTVDVATGALALSGPSFCGPTETIVGTVAADSASFTALYQLGTVDPIFHVCDVVTVPMQGTRVAPVCGDRFVDPGEECDDGNTTDGDGCTAGCTREGCSDQPLPSCHHGLPGGAVLDLRRGAAPDRNAATYRWIRNVDDVSVGELGDPRATTGYALCVWTLSGLANERVVAVKAPAGASCARGPCWTSSVRGTAFVFRDRSASSGVSDVTLRAGASGRANVRWRAKGPQFTPPMLPLGIGVTGIVVQVQGRDATCFESVGSPLRNTPTHVVVK